ncbi:aminotransferase class I/II-fold pyridoxal phosphate-dependent enzyme [Nocardia camponoti]|uniref:GntR family transcriptional regulator n=1 Tax=Nocardia camponoti TaxID=1616106 RepID=A0A917Q9Q7_9NOCA|nr:aminotransferase class I/II-fold pyridoxal phosphate-dependent enzyme [Nocardia camponoti]GGK37624.1 GntR family transcriptional regulator [Nocardia camponoti]
MTDESPSALPSEFVSDLDDRTAAGIAAAVSRRIRSGGLSPGTRLPTVRDVARELRVSPATVSQAWRALSATGAIVARGRAGTFVGEVPSEPAVGRYQRLHSPSDNAFRVDLSRGTPDPALLPDLAEALRALSRDTAPGDLSAHYLGEAVLPELVDAVTRDWPWATERFAVFDGALDAVDRLLAAHVRFGDHVIVEDPCFPPFLDLLARIGARPVAVPLDESGFRPTEFARAFDEVSPRAVILQPRANNPTGASLSATRVRELATILAEDPALIIEDDHSAGIAHTPLRSLAARFPDRGVYLRSYSKSHGADLRLAVVGGPAALLDPVLERRMLGPGWSSRLLQRVLLTMLGDDDACATVAAAATRYRARATALRRALAREGVEVAAGDGINVWLPVNDENAAMISLAAAGVKAAPGGPFEVSANPDFDHLRLTLGALDDTVDLAWLATELATAAKATPTYRRVRRA